MAEGILTSLVETHQLGWEVGSAAVGDYHIGEPPHMAAQKTCQKHQIDISSQCARLFTHDDFHDFDLIYAMDTSVLAQIQEIAAEQGENSRAQLFLDELYPGEHRSVTDPWFGPEAGFEPVFHLLVDGCRAIIRKHAGIIG